MSTNKANLNDTFSISKENAILMLPLKIETRFMRIGNDPALAGMMRMNNSINEFSNIIQEDLKTVEGSSSAKKTLEKGGNDSTLKNRLAELQSNTYNELLKIDYYNKLEAQKKQKLLTERDQLIIALKKEAETNEKQLSKTLDPLSETQEKLTNSIHYFDQNFASKLEKSNVKEAKVTPLTKEITVNIEKAIAELMQLFKTLQGQELDAKELTTLQQRFIAAQAVLNGYVKGNYNLKNPEFKKLVSFANRITAEGKLFQSALNKRLDLMRKPLLAARKVIASKELSRYLQSADENAKMVAPKKVAAIEKNKAALELIEHLNARKSNEREKLLSNLNAQIVATETIKKEAPKLLCNATSNEILKEKTGSIQAKTSNDLISENKGKEILKARKEQSLPYKKLDNTIALKHAETTELLTEHEAFLSNIAKIGKEIGTISTGGIDDTPNWYPPVNAGTFNVYFLAVVDPNDPFTYTFQNNSYSDTRFRQTRWDIEGASATVENGKTNRTFTFPGPGNYKVKLGMNRGKEWKYYETIVAIAADDDNSLPSDGVYELWVRAFPDQIAIDAHSEQLTEREEEDGQIFWKAIWLNADDKTIELSAWRSLVKKHGPQRAAWIVKILTPTNLHQRPRKTVISVPEPNKALTRDELKKGEELWKTLNDSGSDLKKQEDVWTNFQKEVTADKAMEVALSSLEIEKTLVVDKSVSKTEDRLDELPTYSDTPTFPELDVTTEQWTKGSISNVMPSKLLFAVYRKNGLSPYLHYGKIIPSPLPTGINPKEENAFTWDENGNLVVSGGIKWMVDFEEAIEVGMAIRIPITAEEANPNNPEAGFDKVVVVGARDQETNANAKQTLEALFESHHYAGDGLEFIPQGTATNNTGKDNSGYTQEPDSVRESFAIHVEPSQTAKSEVELAGKKVLQRTDGDFLAQQLKINPLIFNHVKGADQREVSDAAAMNQALWGGTLGSYLEDVLYSNDPTYKSLISQETIDQLRGFFINNVKARGSFPILRVKNQPYGILPMMNFRKEQSRDYSLLGTDFESLLQDVLVHRMWKGFKLGQEWKDQDSSGRIPYPNTLLTDTTLKGWWANIMQHQIKNVDDSLTSSDPLLAYQKRFLNLLGLLPNSDELYLRNGVGIEAQGVNFSSTIPDRLHTISGKQFSYNNIKYRTFDFYERFYDISHYKDQYLDTLSAKNGYRQTEMMATSAQLGKIIYSTEETLLNNLVDEQPTSCTRLLDEIYAGKNYLNLLSDKSFDQMINDIKNTQESSHSILHLLSRKSIMHGYWDAAAKIWEKNLLTDQLYSTHHTSHPLVHQELREEPLSWLAAATFLNNSGGTFPTSTIGGPYPMSGPVTAAHIQEILSIIINLCVANNWDLKDVCDWGNGNRAALAITGTNPYNWDEITVKGIIRGYFIDWIAVGNQLGVVDRPGQTRYELGEAAVIAVYSTAQLNHFDGVPLKDFLRGVFIRSKYKSFVAEMDPMGVFETDLDFSINSTPVNNWMDFFNHSTFANKLHFLEENAPFIGKSDSRKMHEYITDQVNMPLQQSGLVNAQHLQQLRETRSAIDYLSTRPTAQLEQTLMEHIDLCSYRLDAWITGLANKKLDDLRDAENYTTRIGAYGWVDDLIPGGTRTDEYGNPIMANVDDLGEATPAIDPENQGYIHAPTANHAAAAAILRSAYVQTEADVFQINLSSERVRKAKNFIDGIRGGIPLAELLGYEFERCLHDIDPSLSLYLDQLRQQFPIIANQLEDAGTAVPVDHVAARNVVNGLALLEAKRLGMENGTTSYPYGITALPNSNSTLRDQFISAIEKIEDTLDGLGDLSIAETVYQAASGNFDRSGAMVKALSNGTTLPDPEVITVPKHRHMIDLRAGIVLPTTGLHPGSSWDSIPLTPKAMAEPALNAWLADQIGNPSDIYIFYTFDQTDTDNNKVTIDGILSLSDVNLHAIDLLPIVGELLNGGTSELHQRIELYIKMQHNNIAITNIKINFSEKDPLAPANKTCLAEKLPLFTELFKLVGVSKAMDAKDLTLTHSTYAPTEDGTTLGIDFLEFEMRLANAHNELATLYADLETYVQATVLDRVSLITALLRVAAFGISEALPINATGQSDADAEQLKTLVDLVRQLIAKKLKEYTNEIQAISTVSAENAPDKKMDGLKKATIALFGNDFYLLPQFRTYNSKELVLTTQNSGNTLPNDLLAMDKWLHGIGKVRGKMNTLENVILIKELEDTDLEFTPLQLPYKMDDQWLGLPYDPEQINIREDKLSLYLSLPVDFAPRTTSYCGLLIDTWTEQITVESEDTAIAFHYDQPNAKAAQSVLLGVHTLNDSGDWDYGEMLEIVNSAADMAKLRAVEPEQLAAEGNILSLLLPGVMDKITSDFSDISTDFGLNRVPSNPVIPSTDDTITGKEELETVKNKTQLKR